MPWKWHSITRLDDFPSQNQPIDFAEQGELFGQSQISIHNVGKRWLGIRS